MAMTKALPDFDGFEADDDFSFAEFEPAAAGPQPVSAAAAQSAAVLALAPEKAAPQANLPATAQMTQALTEAFANDVSSGEAVIPRITVHAFWETAEVAEVVNRAAADRRLARATVNVQEGGLAGAIAHYQNQPTPSLVLVESRSSAPELLEQLDRLAEVCDPGTKVMVVGAANDIALYRELMRRGVSEYLVPPMQVLGLIRSIGGLYADPSSPFVGRQIAFVGARGGVGASTLAHNVAHAISERLHANTVIVDMDLPFGTAGLDFNQDPLQGVADALNQPDRLDPVLLDRMMARCTERLSLFAAPATLDDTFDISAEAFEEVANKIRTTAPFIVFDLPHLWTSWMRRMVLSADDVVIVATPDLASLRNAKNIVDLIRQARPNDTPPRLVLNQVGVQGRPEIPAKDFADALGLQPSAVLPFDPKLFGQAANNGQMLEEVNAKSKAAEGVQQLAQSITRREAPPQRQKSLLEQLFKRKS